LRKLDLGIQDQAVDFESPLRATAYRAPWYEGKQGCSREQSAAADLQCQSHLRIDVACIGAQRRERHAEETNSFAHGKLRRE
jgi:hypothetical protein